jgi:iron-sulfur cluster repair protein YtfE (RIC family)
MIHDNNLVRMSISEICGGQYNLIEARIKNGVEPLKIKQSVDKVNRVQPGDQSMNDHYLSELI